MTITNGLLTLAQFKSAARIADTVDDAGIEMAIEAASREIEGHCFRRFYADASATARVFVPSDDCTVEVDDISTTSGLIVESGAGSTWTTVTSTEYQLEPLNGFVGGQAWPYTRIRSLGATFGVASYDGEATMRVTAKWGWPAVPADVKKAAIVQSLMLFKADDAPFGVAGFGEMGVMRMKSGLHPTAEKLLARFRRNVGIA